MNSADLIEALELVKACVQGDTRFMVDAALALDAETAVRYIMALTTFQAGLLHNITGSEQAAVEYLTQQQDMHRHE